MGRRPLSLVAARWEPNEAGGPPLAASAGKASHCAPMLSCGSRPNPVEPGWSLGVVHRGLKGTKPTSASESWRDKSRARKAEWPIQIAVLSLGNPGNPPAQVSRLTPPLLRLSGLRQGKVETPATSECAAEAKFGPGIGSIWPPGSHIFMFIRAILLGGCAPARGAETGDQTWHFAKSVKPWNTISQRKWMRKSA